MKIEDQKRLLFEICSKNISESMQETILHLLSSEINIDELLEKLDDNR